MTLPDTNRSGIMHILQVRDQEDGEVIGFGFVIAYCDGEMSTPELYDLEGDNMPSGMYLLRLTEYYNVVVPYMVQ
jgi:hypothetical protein